MTTKLSRSLAAAAILGLCFEASAATTEFDSVTSYQAGRSMAVTGIPRNSTTPVRVEFSLQDDSSISCVPVIMTMIEKPGRYYLTMVTGDFGSYPAVLTCTLTLRN